MKEAAREGGSPEAGAVDAELLGEASEWFVRVRTADPDSDVYTSWLAWVEADPRRRVAFATVQRAWDATASLGDLHEASQGEIARVTGTVPQGRRIAAFALAACLALVAVAAFIGRFDAPWLPFPSRADWYERIATGRGEPETAVLADGSRVELGGLTGIEVIFTPERRLVVAEEGESFYRVKHDAGRPFVVQAGPVRVTAIGTAFAIRREGGSVQVVVTEGTVDVTPDPDHTAPKSASGLPAAGPRGVRATAGERVRFNEGEPVPVVKHESDAGWERGQLRFEEEPLHLVVASLNRYSGRRIVIADPALENLLFTGTVNGDGVRDWLSAVPIIFPVQLDQRDPDVVVLEARR